MMFFKKPVVVNAYTSDKAVYEHSKMLKAKANKPKWWKALKPSTPPKNSIDYALTMKSCSGFNDLYDVAYIMPMWTDWVFTFCETRENPPYNWEGRCADERSTATEHPESQRKGLMPSTEWQHIKISSPWFLSCNESINFLMTNAQYSQTNPKDFTVLNGVLNFKYQFATHINLMLPREDQQKTVFIPADEPIALLVPLTERKVEIVHHYVSPEELQNIKDSRNPKRFFGNNYYKHKKCPFTGKS